MRALLGLAAGAAALGFAGVASAAPSVRIKDAVARVVVSPEARNDIKVEFLTTNKSLPLTIRRNGADTIVDLTFEQLTSAGDLDIHLYDDSTNLTPCDLMNQCDTANGQSATSNEHFEYVVPAGCESGCDYHVAVKGYDGAANTYDISILTL